MESHPRSKEKTSQKISWENSTEKRRDISRQNMRKYCLPNSQSDETKLKRVESRKWYSHSKETIEKIKNAQKGRPLTEAHKLKLRKPKKTYRINFKHSNETKKKLSEMTKKQWLDGIHKPKYQSYGHQKIISICEKNGWVFEIEKLINGKPYDVYINNFNIIIEFNGTYWHRDPRFYKEDLICRNIWEKDKNKIDIAKKNGYNVIVVWQYDWEKSEDQEKYLMEKINGYIKQH